MKKFLTSLILLMFCSNAQATSLNITYTNEQPGATILSSHWNQDMQDIQNWANNNNIDGSTNIATNGVTTASIANLAVTDAKIASAGITTAGKLSGSAFTGLSSVPSGAGIIPVANLGSGTGSAYNFLSGDGSFKSPATSFVIGTFTRDVSTASGNQTVSGLGFTPKILIIFASQSGGRSAESHGFSDGTNNYSTYYNGTTASFYYTPTLIRLDTNGADFSTGTASFASGQFTIAWVKTGSPTGTYTMQYLAM